MCLWEQNATHTRMDDIIMWFMLKKNWKKPTVIEKKRNATGNLKILHWIEKKNCARIAAIFSRRWTCKMWGLVLIATIYKFLSFVFVCQSVKVRVNSSKISICNKHLRRNSKIWRNETLELAILLSNMWQETKLFNVYASDKYPWFVQPVFTLFSYIFFSCLYLRLVYVIVKILNNICNIRFIKASIYFEFKVEKKGRTQSTVRILE